MAFRQGQYKRSHSGEGYRWGSRGRGGEYRGGGGGGGGPPHNNVANPTEIQVLTNQNRLTLLPPNGGGAAADKSDYWQYKVIIKNAKWTSIKDEETGKQKGREYVPFDALPDDDGDDARARDRKKKFYKTPYPWRIIKAWSLEHGYEVAYDGAEKAYFPSDSEGSAPGDGQVFHVKVKRDCEADDPDAEEYVGIFCCCLRCVFTIYYVYLIIALEQQLPFISVKDRWFAIRFDKTNPIPYANVMGVLSGDTQSLKPPDTWLEVSTMLNAILKVSISRHSMHTTLC